MQESACLKLNTGLGEFENIKNVQRYLNKRQLAAQLQISIRQLEKLVDAKKIPVTRLGKRCVRFDPDSVKQALSLLEIKAVRRNTPPPTQTKNPTQQISM